MLRVLRKSQPRIIDARHGSPALRDDMINNDLRDECHTAMHRGEMVWHRRWPPRTEFQQFVNAFLRSYPGRMLRMICWAISIAKTAFARGTNELQWRRGFPPPGIPDTRILVLSTRNRPNGVQPAMPLETRSVDASLSPDGSA
jgi:hypothetical protein